MSAEWWPFDPVGLTLRKSCTGLAAACLMLAACATDDRLNADPVGEGGWTYPPAGWAEACGPGGRAAGDPGC